MKTRKTPKPNPVFTAFASEAENIFVDGQLKIIEPNTGNELQFDADKFIISDAYGKIIKSYVSFEKAIDYMMENN